jgi:hypothetical protein
VGEYQRPQFHDTRFVYLGRLTGGEAIERGPETMAVEWFHPDDLPPRLSPSVAGIIADAMRDSNALVRIIHFPFWQVWLAKFLFGLRDLRNHLQGKV